MKDILDYPVGTFGSNIKKEFLNLHEERCNKVTESFGGQDAFFKFIMENDPTWVAEYKRRFEEINGVQFPNNIRFEL
ncbi:hypothetical protein UGMREWDR_CDS0031 [Aeromonas phage GomatiRiver_11]|nr:hypothetical protein OBDJBBDK_00030 [Aeromonas phage AhFM11]WKW84198.1 hypothetical protein UGMREWDR_CDS0031 [Aeromonas phage GomatiRiver_11]